MTQRLRILLPLAIVTVAAIAVSFYVAHRRQLEAERDATLPPMESACKEAERFDAQREPAIEAYAAARTSIQHGQAADRDADWEVAIDAYQRAAIDCRRAVPLAQRRLADEAKVSAEKLRSEAAQAGADKLERYRTGQSAYDAALKAIQAGELIEARDRFRTSGETFRLAVAEMPAANARGDAQSAHIAALGAGVSSEDPRFAKAAELLNVGEKAYGDSEFAGAVEAFVSAKALLEEALRSKIDAGPPGMITFRSKASEGRGKTDLIEFVVGSTAEQIDGAMRLCEQAVKNCNREWYADEERHEVELHAFALDRYETTVAAFARFVEETGYHTTAEELGYAYQFDGLGWVKANGLSWKHPYGPDSSDRDFLDHPVSSMSATDAEAYCKWADARLPTAEEWEFAARGDEGRIFPWGTQWDPTRAHWSNGGTERTRPVGTLATGATPDGVNDLAGNVWEWTATQVGAERVLKGGSWQENNPANLRAAARLFESPTEPHVDGGFRCAKDLSEAP